MRERPLPVRMHHNPSRGRAAAAKIIDSQVSNKRLGGEHNALARPGDGRPEELARRQVANRQSGSILCEPFDFSGAHKSPPVSSVGVARRFIYCNTDAFWPGRLNSRRALCARQDLASRFPVVTRASLTRDGRRAIGQRPAGELTFEMPINHRAVLIQRGPLLRLLC